MRLLNLLLLENTPIWKQLEIEEALLRTDSQNWCIINKGSPLPAIVMGISGKRSDHVNEEKFQETPVTLVRRFSGGGTVVVDESTFFVSFIFEKSDLQIDNCPRTLLEYTGELYRPVFEPLQLRVRENDYAIGEKKIGGNAQYFTKTRALHHTTFLWDYNPQRMALLKMPPLVPEYRQGRSHEEFITTLKATFPSMALLEERLIETLSLHFTLIHHTASSQHILDALNTPHRKALEILS